MDRVVANSVVTEAFFITTGAVRSRIHFFPSAGVAAGHYPVACELTIFGKGVDRRSVRLDGGRLNQPDGIRLEDAFPSLSTETSGVVGLQVSLEVLQGRLNLRSSRVVIEMVSPQFSITFNAAPFRAAVIDSSADNIAPALASVDHVGVAIHDRFSVPTLIAANASSELIRPTIHHVLRGAEAPLQLGTVAATSVVEFPLDEALCKSGVSHATLWGESVCEKFWISPSKESDAISWYVMNRDPSSKRPISVCAL